MASKKFGRHPKPGVVQIVCEVHGKLLIVALAAFFIGVGSKFNAVLNSNTLHGTQQKNCAVDNGRLWTWLNGMSNGLIAAAIVFLNTCGLIPKVLVAIKARNEAITLGCLFMGRYARLIWSSMIWCLLLLFNFWGSSALTDAHIKGLQTTTKDSQWTLEEDATYCKKAVYINIIALQVMVYLPLAIALGLLLWPIIMKIKKARDDKTKCKGKKKKYRPTDQQLLERLRKDPNSAMNVLGIKVPDVEETDSESEVEPLDV